MAIKIYIDQGHNPKNPNSGAEGSGYKEQDITYKIGKELAALLRANGNFEVKESRPTATTSLGNSITSSLQVRVQQANAWGADYFISLHTNASSLPAATGVEAFSYSFSSPGYALGKDIVNNLSRVTGLRNRGMKVRSGLYVLRRTKMPAVLVEMGFITNQNDADLMYNRPDLFARGIYQGILQYLNL